MHSFLAGLIQNSKSSPKKIQSRADFLFGGGGVWADISVLSQGHLRGGILGGCETALRLITFWGDCPLK